MRASLSSRRSCATSRRISPLSRACCKRGFLALPLLTYLHVRCAAVLRNAHFRLRPSEERFEVL
ncbi:MAG: hypothetical protein FJX23_06025 [Alphaproteobacteria bacterium]|nr:hypothetical protein [Alphaproteobacteria bacterium]